MAYIRTEPWQTVSRHFQYDPLIGEHDIRLLKLEENSGKPGAVHGRISGKLVHRSLDDLASNPSTGTYYAITYTWGDSAPKDQLWLSNTEYLPIAASAAYVLRHVTTDEYIWIDSVCINQTDKEEKSIQLRYMWGIYKFAKEVLAWPGGAEDYGDMAMELLFDITYAALTQEMTGRTPVALPISHIQFLPGLNTALWKKSHALTPPEFKLDPERWDALAKFLDRPWWRRAWVIQEVVAARELTVVMGAGQEKTDNMIQWKYFNNQIKGHILKWENIVAVVKHLQTWGLLHLLQITEGSPCDLQIYPGAVACIQRVEALKPARDDDRPNYQDNLLLTMAADATDPKDKIFAIGSMSYGSLTKELFPNYDLSVDDIYINATRHLLMRDQYLMTLHIAGLGWRRNMNGLPSWVPDYSITRRTGTRHGDDLVLGRISGSAMFAAGTLWLSGLQPRITNLGSWRQLLRIKGVVLDDIQVICKGLSPTRSIRKSMNSESWIDRKVIKSWLNMVLSQVCPDTLSQQYLSRSTIIPNSQPLFKAPILESHALASALIVGSSYEGEPMSTHDPHTPIELMYETFTACLEKGIRPSKLSGSPAVMNGLEAYISALDRLPSWTVFRTASGYIGRGPPLAKKGDKVCVFQGARTPFIIRKVALPWYAPATFYHLVGECYVEGLMANEASNRRFWGYITLF